MLPNAEDGNTAFFDIRAEDFPLVITFYSEATGRELHSITADGPGAIQIPGREFFGEPVTVSIKSASDDEVTSPCPNCGTVATRSTYNIGSGPELSCANCEWCWGANGQELKPLNVLTLACPSCGRINELHDGPEPGDTPEDGDLSVCWGCRTIHVYIQTDTGLALREPTPEEAEQISKDPKVKDAIDAVNASRTPREASQLRWSDKETP